MRVHMLPDVYSPLEIAEAAGVPDAQVLDLLCRGEIRSVAASVAAADGRWATLVAHPDAVGAVRALRRSMRLDAQGHPDSCPGVAGWRGEPVSLASTRPRSTAVPLLVSTSLHVVVAAILLVIASLDLTNADEKTDVIENQATPVRLVFLAQAGPGGGGGGGGMRMRTPPPKAQRQGPRTLSSPIPARRLPPPMRPLPRPVEPPPVPLEAKTLPPVMAPVAPVAADARPQEGQLKDVPKDAPASQGSGRGGGTGTGDGTGIGEGNGSGIGPGEGGGLGGGPYRPGSGVEPPRLLKEVRADYTDQARRANVVGEVVLEIVVRRDGTVGDVRVRQRLGSGLDERAIQAVRQWRFAPARLKGSPVDVIVEVSVEFKLR